MKTTPFPRSRWRPAPLGCLVFTSLMVAGVDPGHAQEPAASPMPALQIIQQQVVDVGTHRIVFNRVVPPPPQPTPPAPAPVAAAYTPPTPMPKARAAAGGSRRVARGAAGASPHAGDAEGEPRALFLSATVYDHGQFTELRGRDDAGGWRAWSNVDFLLLAGTSAFATDDGTTCSLYLGLGADLSQWLTQAGQYPAGVSSLPAGQASYYFADGAATAAAHPEAAVALDALHLYVDAHRPALMRARQQREADQAAREAQAEWAQQHPTPLPDTVINFWPKQNSVFLGH